ncbi:MAG TPA: helicase-related protein [Planctomycetota bacterium]
MTTTSLSGPRLGYRAGRIVVHGWPAAVPPPFGLRDLGSHHEGPARLRWRVRQALDTARLPYRDETRQHEPAPSECRPDEGTDRPVAPALFALRLAACRGIFAGLSEATRVEVTKALCGSAPGQALVVVADSGAQHRWQRDLAVDVRTAAAAAADMHWLGSRHELLVVDAVESMPWPVVERVLDASAALARVAFVARNDWRLVSRLAAGLGPVVHVVDDVGGPSCHELRLPMPPAVEHAYAAAWSTFLGAFDRFAAARPGAGFATFVAEMRGDPLQRPALSAWHQALRLAAWHEHKAAAVGELLRRHRGQRVLVFTPSRAAAYELARDQLIAAVTAELPARERSELLDGFANGTLRALAGPRLLDLGVAEGCADVAILAGGGFGADQRRARCRRVGPRGVVYELVSLDTVEVGRARRWRGAVAAR